MKKSTQILKQLALIAAMLTLSSGAWATYYLYRWTSDRNVCSGSITSLGESGCKVTLTTGNNFIGVSTTSGNYYSGTVDMSKKTYSDPNGIVKWCNTTQGYNCSGTSHDGSYHFFNMGLNTEQEVTLTYNGSTLTVTPAGTYYNISTSGSNCTFEPASQSVLSTGSFTFYVTPSSGYQLNSASLSAGTGTCFPTSLGGVTARTAITVSNPSAAGTLSVSASAITNYYINLPAAQFPDAGVRLMSGGSITRVASATGTATFNIYNASSCSAASCRYYKATNATVALDTEYSLTLGSGGYYNLQLAVTEGYTYTFTVVDNVLSVTALAPDPDEASAPTVRLGTQPTINGDCGLTTKGYVGKTGCSNVTKFRLYYSNNRAFRQDGSYKMKVKEFTGLSISEVNQSTNLTLTDAQIGSVISQGEVLYLRCTAYNSTGWSAYSEIVPVTYSCSKFIKSNIAGGTFKACPGEHEFNWTEMFVSPTPTTWEVQISKRAGSTISPATDAKADFNLVGDKMVWNTTDKAAGAYEYTFTANADGYQPATATLTFTYSAPASDLGGAAISKFTASPTTDVYPYTVVTLTTTGTKGNVTSLDYTVTPAGGTVYNTSGNLSSATAKFRAESKAFDVTYTITVTGYTSSCASVSKSVEVTVKKEEDEGC